MQSRFHEVAIADLTDDVQYHDGAAQGLGDRLIAECSGEEMKRDKPEGHLAGEAMRGAVRDQIKAADPPEAKRTFERLRAQGMSRDQAIEFMTAVLASEIFEMLKNKRGYDREHYEAALRALPTLPG